MLERFLASRYNGHLPVRNRGSFQARRIRKITRGSAHSGRQARVRFNLHMNALRFSGHGNSPGERRRLPGNQDSSTARLRPCVRYVGLCRSCSTFRRSSALPSCRTSCKRRDRAWEPPRKTVPDHGDARQGAPAAGASRYQLAFASSPAAPTPLTRRIFCSARASLTRIDVHASIGFCPEPSEWKQPTRPLLSTLGRRH